MGETTFNAVHLPVVSVSSALGSPLAVLQCLVECDDCGALLTPSRRERHARMHAEVDSLKVAVSSLVFADEGLIGSVDGVLCDDTDDDDEEAPDA